MKLFVNILTTLRLIFSLILPIFWFNVPNTLLILSIILIFLTDFVDGFLARKFKVQTLYGSLLDVVADKALSVILMFLLLNKINIFIYVVLMECLIALINTYGSIIGKQIVSSRVGKKKMWILSITIILGYMYNYNLINYNVIVIFSCLTILMQIWTMIDYILNIIKQREVKKDTFKIKKLSDLKYVLFDTEFYTDVWKKGKSISEMIKKEKNNN